METFWFLKISPLSLISEYTLRTIDINLKIPEERIIVTVSLYPLYPGTPGTLRGAGESRRTQCFLFNLLNVSVYLGFEPDILSHINTKHTFPVNIFLLLLLPIILYLFSFLSFFPFSASFFYYSPHYPPCISPYYLFPLFITSTLSFSSLSFHFSPHYPFLPNRINPFSLSSLIFLIFFILFFFFFFFIILIHNPHFSFHLHPFFLNFLLLSSWVPGLCLPCILF